MRHNRSHLKFGLIIAALVLVGFAAGIYVGIKRAPAIDKVVGVTNKDNVAITSQVDFDPFWKTWNLLNTKYVPSSISSTSPEQETLFNQKLVWGAISGLTAAVGDPYTVFFPPQENEIFKSDIAGNFGGVGMEIGERAGVLTVISPLKNSPAEKAGIKAGDKILEIEGTSTQGVAVDEAVGLIRGEKGTSVKLTLYREGLDEPLKVSVMRDTIELPTLDTEVKTTKTGKVFVIKLYSFSATSPNLFRNALQEFIGSGTNKLVVDLRGNPGGYLEAAVDMASWFLPEGKTVVREYFGEGKPEEVHRSRGYNIFSDQLKLAVIVNGGSASASEILAGALSENGVAKLVGETTFGKGSVQELIDVTDKTAVKITVARWLTPEGHSISHSGIKPDYEATLTKDDVEKRKDPQMEKAIEILSQ